jgi:hypothetical protein
MGRENINKVVGRTGHEYFAVNDFFEHGGANPLKGVTGSVLRPVSAAQVEEDTDSDALEERFEDIWRESVKSGSTELGLAAFAESIYLGDGLEAVYDLSDYDLGEEAAKLYNARLEEGHDPSEEAEFSECIGGGRIFDAHMLLTMDEVFDEELRKRVAEQEGINIHAVWVIRQTTEQKRAYNGYWDGVDSFVHVHDARFYTDAERANTTLPEGGKWVDLTTEK